MSYVVTKWDYAWRQGRDTDEIMKWLGEMSLKGWELKGFTATVHEETIRPGLITNIAMLRVVMQRPIAAQFFGSSGGTWEYPG
jgi:hypothetical protein